MFPRPLTLARSCPVCALSVQAPASLWRLSGGRSCLLQWPFPPHGSASHDPVALAQERYSCFHFIFIFNVTQLDSCVGRSFPPTP